MVLSAEKLQKVKTQKVQKQKTEEYTFIKLCSLKSRNCLKSKKLVD